MKNRRALKLESLEIRRLFASDLATSVEESIYYTPGPVDGDAHLVEGLFGGPRVEANRNSSQHYP